MDKMRVSSGSQRLDVRGAVFGIGMQFLWELNSDIISEYVIHRPLNAILEYLFWFYYQE